MTKIADRISTLVLVGTTVLTLFVLFGPRGVLGRRIGQWREDRRGRAEVLKSWASLSQFAQRLGARTGAPILIEVSDYQCPFCRLTAPNVNTFLKAHPDVALGYVHFPLSIHKYARPAAIASLCADKAGFGDTMHNELMTSENWQSDSTDWVKLGRTIGIRDTASFRSCLTDSTVAARLDAGIKLIDSLHIGGTPTFLWQSGDRHTGSLSYEELNAAR